jgi:hypothetical protein
MCAAAACPSWRCVGVGQLEFGPLSNCDPLMRVLSAAWPQMGRTVLMLAAAFGRTATAAELVRLGADINAKDDVRVRCTCARGPRRARSRARLCGELSWTRVLQGGQTALMLAAANGRTATATELVQLGADVNAKGNVCFRCSCARGPRA